MAEIGEIIRNREVIVGYEDKMLIEEKEKIDKNYISQSLDHNIILISPEIDEQIKSNRAFETVIKTALSEIADILDKEFHGQIGYIIEIYIFQDFEFPDWRNNVIRIKVPIKNPKYILRLWDKISDRVWDKVTSIEENAEEIEKVEGNTRIAIDILE
jgi:hypothetical protein